MIRKRKDWDVDTHLTSALRAATGRRSMIVLGASSGGGAVGSLLPAGYLSTNGSQIIDASGQPVRIDAIGWSGTDSLTYAPYGLWQTNLQQDMDRIASAGFNTVRIPWTDLLLTASPLETASYGAINFALNPDLQGLDSMQLLDAMVAAAARAGLKVIFDHHDNDGGPGGWGGQQSNGLWFDQGPGSDGTDGSGTVGTVTAAQFLADSVALAQRYAGNSTVIGFDLDNEPNSAGNINWGQGGPTDIEAMYTQVGNAIQAVNPGALIICEGPEEWSGPAPGMPAGFGEGDLSGVATDPVQLTLPGKVVYSVHEYPPDLSGNGSYDKATQIAAMNAGWGYLVTNNIAPVWIGEMGADMSDPKDAAWIQTVLDYMNGKDAAAGGPSFTGTQQPVSGTWWQFGAYPGQALSGILSSWTGGLQPAQIAASNQLAYTPSWSGTAARLNGQQVQNFAPGAVLDITDVSAAQAAISALDVGSTQSVLTVTDGAHSATFTLLGDFLPGAFTLSPDGNGGTHVTLAAGAVASYIVLPTGAISVSTGPVSSTVVATAATLNPADRINATSGAGITNIMMLSGGGKFDLAALASFTGFSTAFCEEGQGPTAQTIKLRDGTTLTLAVLPDTVAADTAPGITIIGAANSDTIRLGVGNDVVTLGGSKESVISGGGDNTFYVTGATIQATIEGGSTGYNTLVVADGGSAVMGTDISGITEIQLQARTTLTVNAEPGLVIRGNSTGGDVITLGNVTQRVLSGGANETIVAKGGIGAAQISGLGSGSLLRIAGGGTVSLDPYTQVDTVALQSATALRLNGMGFITAVGSAGGDTIVAGGANQILTGGRGSDTLVGSTFGSDIFRDTGKGLQGDVIRSFLASDRIDLIDIAPTAKLAVAYKPGSDLSTISLSSTTGSTKFTLAGKWSAAGFTLTSDGQAGSILTHT